MRPGARMFRRSTDSLPCSNHFETVEQVSFRIHKRAREKINYFICIELLASSSKRLITTIGSLNVSNSKNLRLLQRLVLRMRRRYFNFAAVDAAFRLERQYSFTIQSSSGTTAKSTDSRTSKPMKPKVSRELIASVIDASLRERLRKAQVGFFVLGPF